MGRAPDWRYERRAVRQGFRVIAGLDEVGRGSLAGPVVVAAVVLESGKAPDGIRDSKLLTSVGRDRLIREILRQARAWGVGIAGPEEIDTINILNATKKAMWRAVEALPISPDHLLIDALRLPQVPIGQTAIVKGDQVSVSIASASILAKVVRDRLMGYYDRLFPGFEFARNKGYGTESHRRAVAELGPCRIHRRSFRGVWIERELPFAQRTGQGYAEG